MSESSWPLVEAAVHQLGAHVQEASTEHLRLRIESAEVELRRDDGRAGLQAFADLGAVDKLPRECCFEALLSVNLELFKGGRSTLAVDADGRRIVFASRIGIPENASYVDIADQLHGFCACASDMRGAIVRLSGQEHDAKLPTEYA